MLEEVGYICHCGDNIPLKDCSHTPTGDPPHCMVCGCWMHSPLQETPEQIASSAEYCKPLQRKKYPLLRDIDAYRRGLPSQMESYVRTKTMRQFELTEEQYHKALRDIEWMKDDSRLTMSLSPVRLNYIILYGVENNSQKRIPVEKAPRQVWTLLDEAGFHQLGLIHHHTAFIEDRMHDWDYSNGMFRFYGHSSGRGDVQNLVLVYD